MKFIASFLVSILIVSQVIAATCNTTEAQFSGHISSYEMTQGQCVYEVEVSKIWEHSLCPLSRVVIESKSFSINPINNQCPYKLGQGISGILVHDNDGTLFLD